MNKVTTKNIVDYFGLNVVAGDKKALSREVLIAEIDRPGLELTGVYDSREVKRGLLIGEKEYKYYVSLDYETQVLRAKNLMSNETPFIVISRGMEYPESILKVAREKNFPLLQGQKKTSELLVSMLSYLEEKLAHVDNYHGVLLNIYGIGVMIMGESGVGKSEITLDLIERGHIFVADDRIDIIKVHNKLMGFSPEILYGMLEIRGVGFIDVDRMFGVTALLNRCYIDMIIKLEKFEDVDRVESHTQNTLSIHGIEIPETILPVREGRSMSVIVEAAVRNFRLKKAGIDSGKEFEERIIEIIKNKKEEDN